MTTSIDTAYVHDLELEIRQGDQLYVPLGVIATQTAITGPARADSTAYAVGDRVIPAVANGYAYSCTVAGTSAASPPTFPTVVGKTYTDGTATFQCEGATTDRDYLLDTTGYTAELEVRDEDYAGATQLEATTANGRVFVGFTPNKWVASTAYSVGQQIVPTLLNGFVYQCVVAGSSHATTEPTWPTTLGQTVLDNTARWRCELAENLTTSVLVSNLVIDVPLSVTEALTDWGRGVFTLQLKDSFGQVRLWADGIARLRREATV